VRTNPNSSRTVRHSMVAGRPAVAALSQVKEFIITVLVSRISTRLCGRRRLLTVHGIESLQACRRQERPHTRTAEATVGTGPRAGRRLAVLASACGLRPWPPLFSQEPRHPTHERGWSRGSGPSCGRGRRGACRWPARARRWPARRRRQRSGRGRGLACGIRVCAWRGAPFLCGLQAEDLFFSDCTGLHPGTVATVWYSNNKGTCTTSSESTLELPLRPGRYVQN